MQLKDYLNVIVKRWWIAALVALIAAATAYGYSLIQPKLYESSVTVQGTTGKPDEGLNNTIKADVKRFSSSLTSNVVAQKIDERGKFDLGADAISSKIKAVATPDNYILKITVSDTDRFRAARIADAAADIIKEDNLAKQAGIPDDSKTFFDKISPAPIPDRPSTPRTALNTGAGFALGLVVGLILIFVIEFFDTTLRTEEDVERHTSLNVIGVIPPWRASRATAAQPVVSTPLRSNLNRTGAAADASGPLEKEFSEISKEETNQKRELK